MKLYIDIKEMEFGDGVTHNIVNKIKNVGFLGYDEIIELPEDDPFILIAMEIEYTKDENGEDTDEIADVYFITKEQDSWWNFPLYELKDGQIVDFNYADYKYFTDTDRRMALADKISRAYNGTSEMKVLRKTLKHIMDTLDIEYPDNFKKYNSRVEKIIAKNPK